MNLISSYSKIYTIGHRAILDLFEEPVLIEEKIDGSQFSFGIFSGELICRSRNCLIDNNNPGMFLKAVDTAKMIAYNLTPEYIYRGEFLSKPKHNVLAYGRVPRDNIIIFDIDTNGLMNYMSYEDKVLECSRIGLECVPRLYGGKIDSFEEFMGLLDNDSCLGEQKVEGIVCKNYSRFTRDGKTVMGKFVREDFKEKHNKNTVGESHTTLKRT